MHDRQHGLAGILTYNDPVARASMDACVAARIEGHGFDIIHADFDQGVAVLRRRVPQR